MGRSHARMGRPIAAAELQLREPAGGRPAVIRYGTAREAMAASRAFVPIGAKSSSPALWMRNLQHRFVLAGSEHLAIPDGDRSHHRIVRVGLRILLVLRGLDSGR